MGKKSKQGAALRAKRRADAAANELVEQAASKVETGRVESKADEDLFVLDSAPRDVTHLGQPRKKRRVDKDGRKLPKNRLSEIDERQIKRLIRAHSAGGVADLAREGRRQLERKKFSKRLAGRARTNFDLWGDGEGATAAGAKTKKVAKAVVTGQSALAGTKPVQIEVKGRAPGDGRMLDSIEVSNRLKKAREAAKLKAKPTVAVDVAASGQSYRPDPEAHQDVIGEALAVELRRNEAVEYRRAPIGGGLSEETKAILVGSSDDDSDGSDDEEEEEGREEAGYRPHRKKEKLTRAQRNKQKRVRAERAALEQRRENKRLLASLSDAKKYSKELAREEKEKAERRQQIKQLKAESASEPLGTDLHNKLSKVDPISAPSVPVALTSELTEGGGVLRTLKPKGSLLTERMESLQARKLAMKKKLVTKKVVQGKRRKMKGGKDREYLLI